MRIIFCFTLFFLSGCSISRQLDDITYSLQSTRIALDQNMSAIAETTKVVAENNRSIRKDNEAIEENLSALERTTKKLKDNEVTLSYANQALLRNLEVVEEGSKALRQNIDDVRESSRVVRENQDIVLKSTEAIRKNAEIVSFFTDLLTETKWPALKDYTPLIIIMLICIAALSWVILLTFAFRVDRRLKNIHSVIKDKK